MFQRQLVQYNQDQHTYNNNTFIYIALFKTRCHKVLHKKKQPKKQVKGNKTSRHEIYISSKKHKKLNKSKSQSNKYDIHCPHITKKRKKKEEKRRGFPHIKTDIARLQLHKNFFVLCRPYYKVATSTLSLTEMLVQWVLISVQ